MSLILRAVVCSFMVITFLQKVERKNDNGTYYCYSNIVTSNEIKFFAKVKTTFLNLYHETQKIGEKRKNDDSDDH